MKKELIETLRAEAAADLKKGMLSWNLFCNNMVAIGDHTTKDLYDDLLGTLDLISSSREKLETLKYLEQIE